MNRPAVVIVMMFSFSIPLDTWAESESDDLFSLPVSVNDPDDNFKSVSAALAEAKILRGHFQQEKQLKILKRPLKSNGYYVHAKGQGLYWRIEKPVQVSYVIKDTGITEFHENSDNSNIQGGRTKDSLLTRDWEELTSILKPPQKRLSASSKKHLHGFRGNLYETKGK